MFHTQTLTDQTFQAGVVFELPELRFLQYRCLESMDHPDSLKPLCHLKQVWLPEGLMGTP